MSAEVLLPNSPGDWSYAWGDSIEAGSVPGYPQRYIPIPPIDVPIVFESHILVAQTIIPDANPRWRMGCRLRQLLEPTPFPIGNIQGSERIVPPNRGTLVIFPRLTNQYRLQVWVPYWFKEISINLYQYAGVHVSRLEDLIRSQADLIRVDLARVEFKIDQL